MKVGGRREIVIPASLTFGAKWDVKYGIQPNDSMIYVIDLLKVKK